MSLHCVNITDTHSLTPSLTQLKSVLSNKSGLRSGCWQATDRNSHQQVSGVLKSHHYQKPNSRVNAPSDNALVNHKLTSIIVPHSLALSDNC